MNKDTLHRANALSKQIAELNEALHCFEWAPDMDRPEATISTKPRLIIDFDGGDGRDQVKVPMNLSDTLVEILKREIKSKLDEAMKQFEAL